MQSTLEPAELYGRAGIGCACGEFGGLICWLPWSHPIPFATPSTNLLMT